VTLGPLFYPIWIISQWASYTSVEAAAAIDLTNVLVLDAGRCGGRTRLPENTARFSVGEVGVQVQVCVRVLRSVCLEHSGCLSVDWHNRGTGGLGNGSQGGVRDGDDLDFRCGCAGSSVLETVESTDEVTV
jgi:hypothetical protein